MVLLCDFHREKSWHEWTSKIDNGVARDQDAVLTLLRNIAQAQTVADSLVAINSLKQSQFWINNEKLRHWFDKTWFPHIKVYTHQ